MNKVDLNPARQLGETDLEYKLRRKAVKHFLKQKKKGELFFLSKKNGQKKGVSYTRQKNAT